jgi:hypothetical protein
MGRYITTTGTSGAVTRQVNGTYQAIVNDRILANSTGGAFSITLPLNTTLMDGDTVQVFDAAGTAGTSNITILRNGALINGVADNIVIDLANTVVTLTYSGPTYGWMFVAA